MSIRVILVLMLITLSLMGCSSLGQAVPSKTTDTRSTSFATESEKIAFLKQYLTMPSAVKQTEFHVVYHDNSGGFVAGPSEWDIQAAIRIAPDDIVHWTDGMQLVESSTVDLAWAHTLVQQGGWNVNSDPVVYERSGSMVAVYESDGVVAKRVWTTR